MFSKILDLVKSLVGSYGSSILKIGVYVIVFLSGVYVTYLYYDHQIQVIENESIKAVSDIKSQSIIELQKREQETAKIISERDNEKIKHDADVRRLNDIINGMRSDGGSSQSVSSASGDSTKPTAESIGECKRLLLEGAKLLGEGVELSGNLSIDKDAVVKMATQQKK